MGHIMSFYYILMIYIEDDAAMVQLQNGMTLEWRDHIFYINVFASLWDGFDTKKSPSFLMQLLQPQ